MIPVIRKTDQPEAHSKLVTEIPNVLTLEQINTLREYSMSEVSGRHRRGSKDPGTIASFFTCQVFRHDDPIYEILNPIWEAYIQANPYDITFIEPYEIKCYEQGDKFKKHTDGFIDIERQVTRKLNMIIQLSDTNDYVGGDLNVGRHTCSRELGSAVLFHAGVFHDVTMIESGTRYSLIGHAWGPMYR
jgi:predicted 2-oxoglutarate/Fe(II)-dependent dioxygenase YbiX